MDGTAIIYTNNSLQGPSAKTAHGLLRHGKRYRILAVIDEAHAGKDAGSVMDGKPLGIPVFGSLSAYLSSGLERARYCIIGIASAGGRIDPAWIPTLEEAIQAGMSLVNGMHHLLIHQPRLLDLAKEHAVDLIDVRKPKPASELPFWTGDIARVGCPIVPVLGSDCAVGKRTTARFIEAACNDRGIRTEMIYTGQTGWLQGGKYGFIFDSTQNDFVCGALENAILECWEKERPDLILVEGQAALRNPSGPCGTEMLISGRANACLFVHPAGRTHYKGWEHLGLDLPPPEEEIALIRAFGVKTIGVALNTRAYDPVRLSDYRDQLQARLGVPVALPLEEGVKSLVDALETFLQQWNQERATFT